MKMIDWDKPYATVCGPMPFPGARHEQDGKYYNAKGHEVFPDQEVKRLKDEGLTDTEIGERLNISRQKVTKILCG